MMIRWIALSLLVLATIFIWTVPIPEKLVVSFLDVGQGDAIFIESPSGAQVLIDGGPDASVLRGLGSRMPFWDRSIDLLIATHPDKDHIAGLTDVLQRYDVAKFLESGVVGDTSPTRALTTAIESEGLEPNIAKRGMRILLGGGAYADILFPDRDVSRVETNTGSIIMRLVYGDTSFMLTGDAPSSVEKHLLSYGALLKSDVLKAGHHGSKTSSSEEFLSAVAPSYGVFSRGCDNTYGHPASEVVARFEKMKIPTLDTCEAGTITFVSDGKTLRVR